MTNYIGQPKSIIISNLIKNRTTNKALIVDASESDRRLMAGLLVKSGYEPIAVETMEAAKDEVALSPWRSQRSVERNYHPAQ